jgi:hypothetical protein
VHDLLAAVAGGRDSPAITPGHRTLLAELPQAARTDVGEWLKDLKSFTPLGCDDVQGRGLERLGARVSHVCYYRMTTSKLTVCWTVYRTADGKIAHAVPDR